MDTFNFDHLDMTSANGARLNIEELYRIAPSVFTEARDPKTGKVCRKVDFEALRRLLGDDVVDGDGECYRFTWVGKNEAKAEAARPTDKTLRPVPEDSVDWDNTKNIYIEGDNLEVLKLLQRSYLGKVKMIYIDPPYNTGNDFVYDDDFSRTEKAEDLAAGNVDELGLRYRKNTDSNGKFHSDWCSMIYPRLLVARTLLSDDGVIFISIDDNEVENLKKICNEVLGERNFVACINWRRSGGRQDSKYYAVIHEYILCYAKLIDRFEAGEEIKRGDVYPKYDEVKKRYYKTTLLRKWGSNSLRENRPNLYYPIKGPDGSDVYPKIFSVAGDKSPATLNEIQGCWRWGRDTMNKAIEDGRIEFKKNEFGEWIAYEKIFAPNVGEEKTKKYTTWIDDLGNGTSTIKNLFGTTVFDYSKSADMVSRFFEMAGVADNDIILDFFSGSATTAHAVMLHNTEHDGNRKFIMVQLPELTDEDSEAYKAGYKNICEIGEERIRRAGKQIVENLESKLDNKERNLDRILNAKPSATVQILPFDQQKEIAKNVYEEKAVPLMKEIDSIKDRIANLDTGFRVFRLDGSNYEEVAKSPKEYSQETLGLFENNIKADRTDLDLLFGAMLAWGVMLDLPMTKETVDGCTVYTVNDGDLVACFSEGITDGVVKAMAAKMPLRVLFRDSCFTQDAQKINIYEQFKQLMDWTDDEAFKNIRVI